MCDNFGLKSNANLTLIEFDEQQKAKIGNALKSMVDQIVSSQDEKLRNYKVDDGNNSNGGGVLIINNESADHIVVSNLKQGNENVITFCTTDGMSTLPVGNKEDQPMFGTTTDSSTYVTLTKEEPQLQQIETEPSVSDETLLQYSKDLSNLIEVEKSELSKDCYSNIEYVESKEPDFQDGQGDDPNDGQDSDIDYNSFIYYICPECGVDCGPYAKWKSHTERQHRSNTIAWHNISSITNTKGESYYQCLDCNTKLTHKLTFKNLQEHRIRHLPYKFFLKCSSCDKRFQTISSIYRHIKTDHAKLAYLNMKPSNPNMTYVKIFCPICQQSQLNIKCWRQHLKQQHDFANKTKSQTTQLGNGMLTCKLCPQKIRPCYVQTHMLIHEPNKSFQCSLCGKYETHKNAAIQHVNGKHFRNEFEFECSYCEATFSKKILLSKHYRKFHKNEIVKCTVCDREFFNASELFSHMNTSNHFSDLNQYCKNLSKPQDAAVVKAGISNSPNQLHINKTQLETTNNLSTYSNLIKEEPQLQLINIEPSIADKIASGSSEDLLNSHEKKSINIQSFGQQEFGILKDCCDNVQNDEFIVDSTESNSEDEQNDNQNFWQDSDIDYSSFIHYICPECGVDCGSQLKWKSHTEKQHKSNTIAWLNFCSITNEDGESYYQCLDCNTKLNQKLRFRHLKDHRIKHLPHRFYLKCGSCDKRFKTLYSIYPHIRKYHAKLANLKKKPSNPKMKFIKIFCPICQQSQSNIMSLRQHLKNQHNFASKIKSQSTKLGNGMYSCKLCPRKMRRCYLQTHMLVHEPHKSFQCTLCEKYQSLRSSALQHMHRTHFGYALKCSYCKSTFAKKSLLWKHHRECHIKEIVNCTVCYREFPNAADLFTHMSLTNHSSDLNQSSKNLPSSEEVSSVQPEILNSSEQPHCSIDSTSTLQIGNKDEPIHITVTKEEPKLQRIQIELSIANDVLTDFNEDLSISNEKKYTNLQYAVDDGCSNGKEEFEYLDSKELSYRNEVDLMNSNEKKPEDIKYVGDDNCGISNICNSIIKDDLDSKETFTQDEQNDAQNDEEDSDIDYNGFIQHICPECGVECGPYSKWKLHTETQHMSNTTAWLNFSSITNVDGESYYQCLDCSTKLSHRSRFRNMQEHRIKHLPHKFYLKCGSCDKTFKTLSTIYTHIRKYHFKLAYSKKNPSNPNMKYIKIFCPICQQSQLNIRCWQEHLTMQHDYLDKVRLQSKPLGDGMYSCKLCQQKMRQYYRQVHMLKHEPNKSFQCTLCEKYETQLSVALQHMHRSHFGYKLKCNYCEATFAKKSLLWKHHYKFHKNEIIECTVCHVDFTNASELFSHMNSTNHFSDLNQSYKNA